VRCHSASHCCRYCHLNSDCPAAVMLAPRDARWMSRPNSAALVPQKVPSIEIQLTNQFYVESLNSLRYAD
jgi:hypothetical protein